jgi:hypothetical protein
VVTKHCKIGRKQCTNVPGATRKATSRTRGKNAFEVAPGFFLGVVSKAKKPKT